MSLTFVNLNGEAVNTRAQPSKAKSRNQGPEEFHKGFRVVGIAPGAYEAAERDRQRDIESATAYKKAGGLIKIPPPLAPYSVWANGAKPTPIRPKPYEILEAAQQCKELAEKAGWDRVRVVELKREKQPNK